MAGARARACSARPPTTATTTGSDGARRHPRRRRARRRRPRLSFLRPLRRRPARVRQTTSRLAHGATPLRTRLRRPPQHQHRRPCLRPSSSSTLRRPSSKGRALQRSRPAPKAEAGGSGGSSSRSAASLPHLSPPRPLSTPPPPRQADAPSPPSTRPSSPPPKQARPPPSSRSGRPHRASRRPRARRVRGQRSK